MKKRFKIITTVASLCLAVALMAFGVYAAANSTFTVTSSVSFTSQVAVTWGLDTEGGAAGNTHVTGYTKEITADKEATTDDATGALITKTIGDLAFGAATNEEKTITYTITAHNPSGSTAITVTCTSVTLPTHDNVTVTVANAVEDGESTVSAADALTTAFSATVAAGDTLTITITCTLEDTAIAVANNNTLNVTLSATSAA